MAGRADPTVPVAVVQLAGGVLPWLIPATGSATGDGASRVSERNQFRGFNCWMRPVFCLGSLLLATGAAAILEGELLKELFVASEGAWFSPTSCAGLIGSSSSRRTTSTLTRGADELSALPGAAAGAARRRVVPGEGEAAAPTRAVDGDDTVGGEVAVTDDLNAEATSGGAL